MSQKRVLVQQTVSPRKRMGSGDETNKCLAFLFTHHTFTGCFSEIQYQC